MHCYGDYGGTLHCEPFRSYTMSFYFSSCRCQTITQAWMRLSHLTRIFQEGVFNRVTKSETLSRLGHICTINKSDSLFSTLCNTWFSNWIRSKTYLRPCSHLWAIHSQGRLSPLPKSSAPSENANSIPWYMTQWWEAIWTLLASFKSTGRNQSILTFLIGTTLVSISRCWGFEKDANLYLFPYLKIMAIKDTNHKVSENKAID